MRTPFLLFITFLFCLQLTAQTTYELGLFIGASNYAGDLVRSTVPSFKDNGFTAGLVGRSSFNRQLSLRGNLLVGSLRGDDYLSGDPGRVARGFRFTNTVAEMGAMLEWEPLGRRRFYTDAGGSVDMNNLISPYIFTGLSMVFVQYDVDFSRYEDKSLDSRIALDQAIGSTNTLFALPMGFGLKLDLSKRMVFGLEFSARYSFSDYVDGISQSGTPENNDWYYYGGGVFSYRFTPGIGRRR